MDMQRCLLVRILDGADDPTDLPLALLQDITDNFSEERKIGQGGFGVVYKGVLGELFVAVKRIHINENTVDDKLFRREYDNLKNINHRNVVRFLGFCSNTHHKTIEDTLSGRTIFANVLERLLCFEYIGNGSLDKHIADELRGLEWETRYEIIIGICKGLRYLHEEKKIIHMDLKPANILLHQDDKYLVPKITDFGLSRTNENSHTVGKVQGTRGYMAPEYREAGKTTLMCDIYSLGLIIIELVTGCMEVPNKDNVLRRWRHRWSKPPTQLRYQQVTRCMEIAGLCRAEKPEARPSISKIIRFLSESESTSGPQSTYLDDDMLGIEPLELHYTVQLNKEVSWLIKLSNRTKACFAFKIEGPSKQYTIWPCQGVVPSECNECLVQITMGPPQVKWNGDKLSVWSTKVSESLMVEHITEHTFHNEADKVIDQVDLRVVCDPTEPQQNIGSRKGTNMSAEDIHEANKRNLAESSSGKGKSILGRSENATVPSVELNSGVRGECTAHTEQCNLHTLHSFSRHFPANLKYLGDNSQAVDSTRGAMGSVLDKLGKLVMEDYRMDPNIKKDIESFSENLRNMHRDLLTLGNIEGAKDWVDEVREISYHIEDMVDSFLVHVEPNSNRSGGFKELKHKELKLLVNGILTHDKIDEVIRNIKDKVKDVAERKERYTIYVKDVLANKNVNVAIDNLRNSAIYDDVEEQLVGIEVPRDELMSLLKKDVNVPKENLRVISIFGMGGLGKTTLAKVVYDKIQAEYDLNSFVPVGQSADLTAVLKYIISEVKPDLNAENLIPGQLIRTLKQLLKNKRYFIVIDDVWDSATWDVIKSALPESKNNSRVIITTRNHDVALGCSHPDSEYVYGINRLSGEDSKKLFFGRAFGLRKDNLATPRQKDISEYILKRCGGMPLAINSIASRLFGKEESTWEYVWKCLGAMTEGNDGLQNMKQILDVSYIHLRDDLKTCMLYVCMYPEDRKIDKNDLLRQWVAEGIVSGNGSLDAEDVAENNFKELINMCMLEPGDIDDNNEVFSCRVHDIILDLMRSKSSKLNFTHTIDGSNYVTEARGKIRRVFVQRKEKEDMRIFETMNKGSLSCVRSFLLDSTSSVPCPFLPHLMEMKYVRVLHLNDSELGRVDLTCISGMFLLRYLWVSFFRKVLGLPERISDLRQLETVYLLGSVGSNCPSDIVSLPQLVHLTIDLSCENLPDEICRLKSLRTLKGDFVCSVDSMKSLGELTNLTTLDIRVSTGDQLKEEIIESMNALHSSISRISTCLRILGLHLDHVPSCWSGTPFPAGSHIWKLDLSSCHFQKCPKWIGELHGLRSFCIEVMEVADAVSIVAGLPLLAYFQVEIDMDVEEEKEESVVISGSKEAFKALKELYFNCRKASLTFEEGALPKLEKLYIAFSHNRYHRFLPAVGIEHLPAPTLKHINLGVHTVDDEANWECYPSRGSLPPNTPSSHDMDDRDDEASSRGSLLPNTPSSHDMDDRDDEASSRGSLLPNTPSSHDMDDRDDEASGCGSLPPNTPRSQDMDDSDDEAECIHNSGSQDSEDDYLADNIRKQLGMLSYLLKRACKEPYPGANIHIDFEDYDSSDEAEYCNEEAVDDGLVQMGLPQSVHLCQLTSDQLSTLMQILYTQDFESVQMPPPALTAPSLPSSLDLTLELALPLHGSSPPTPCSLPGRTEPRGDFPVHVNIDLEVKQGNNGVLVSELTLAPCSSPDTAPPGGLVDRCQAPGQLNHEEIKLNEDEEATSINGSPQFIYLIGEVQQDSGKIQAVTNFPVDISNGLLGQLNNEELMELNEDVEPTSINCSSCIHAAANLCFIILLRIHAICNSLLMYGYIIFAYLSFYRRWAKL